MKFSWFVFIGFTSLLVLGACDEGIPKNQSDTDTEKGRQQEHRKGKPAQDEGQKRQFKNRPVPVAVATARRGRVDAYYSSTTSLTAKEEALVVARTQGVVEAIYVEEGDAVTAGTPLAQLDTRKLKLEVARTRTNLESFKRAYTRSVQLMDSKMISPDAFDRARFDYEREQATLALQLHDLKEATIRAPIDGLITLRYIKLGHSLSPTNPTFEIKRTDKLEAVLNVPEKELSKLQVNQLAVVSVDALENKEFTGVVARIAPEVDASSGTFRVTIALENPNRLLKPGMFSRINIRYDSNENSLLIAKGAVVVQKDESTVFIVRDGLAMRQQVDTGYTMGNDIEILAGLGEGDRVVITGQGGLRDGAPVRIVSL